MSVDGIKVEPVPVIKEELEDGTCHFIAEDDVLHDPAAINMEQVLIEEWLPAIKKEEAVKEESDDLQDVEDKIVIKEEFPVLLNNLMEKSEFEEENAESNVCDRSSRETSQHIEEQYSSFNNGDLIGCGGEGQPSVTRALPDKFCQKSKRKQHLTVRSNEEPLIYENLENNARDLSIEKDSVCKICSKGFRTMYAVKQHLVVHSNARFFKCRVCSKAFNTSNGLNKHFNVHNEMTFECSVCSKLFPSKTSLKMHLLLHSQEKVYECNLCPKVFRLKSSLIRHILIHKSDSAFECEMCSKAFPTRSKLERHLLMHIPATTFQCDWCFKAFRIKSKLIKHLVLQNDVRSFKCGPCKKAFPTKSQHKRDSYVHKKELFVTWRMEEEEFKKAFIVK